MLCRWHSFGCTYSLTGENGQIPRDFFSHEKDISSHAHLITPDKVFDLLTQCRDQASTLTELAKVLEKYKENEDSDSNDDKVENENVVSKKRKTDNTVSVPFVKNDQTVLSILQTQVYGDMTDEITFPEHFADAQNAQNPQDAQNLLLDRYVPLLYPNVVIENGEHNSLIRVMFKTNDLKHTHFGIMNARGSYLRRFIQNSRHTLADYVDEPAQSSMFSYVHVHEEKDQEDTYSLVLQFRDFADQVNMFEGHYRDLRIVLFCLSRAPSPRITAYDAGCIFRVSPNKFYLTAKRLTQVISELKWDEPAPAAPPMMGVRPTMRMCL